MADARGKRMFGRIVCVLCWAVTALLGFLEAFCVYLWIRGTLYVAKWGAEENPYAAEDAWMAGVFSFMTALALLAMLALAIYCTQNLRKRGKQGEHTMSDKR